jgi:hypothetical protein
MYGYMDEQLRGEHENMLETLTRCQQESTRLVLENQELKAHSGNRETCRSNRS